MTVLAFHDHTEISEIINLQRENVYYGLQFWRSDPRSPSLIALSYDKAGHHRRNASWINTTAPRGWTLASHIPL